MAVKPEPEPWQTNQPGAFLTIADVSVWALGDQRFRVVLGEDSREVDGFQHARQLAHELAAS
jgi:hypothetical protein